MSQPKRIIKTDDENKILNDLLAHIEDKYGISKDIILSTLDTGKIAYKLENYKITLQSIDDEIEAININKTNSTTTKEVIESAINKLIEREEKEREINNKSTNKNIHKINEKKRNLQNPSVSLNIDPAKKVNVKYNTNIVYNLGENKMESKFNEINPEINSTEFQTLQAYDLLPKDYLGQRDGYEKYFSEIKEKFLEDSDLKNDQLLEKNKFVLFVAFDVIDAKPTFDDLIGINPLNDYKKYVLKININNNNLFLVSGQIIFIEGDVVDDGKVIEVRNFRNIYKIHEYNLLYEQISYFYQNSWDPYALYYMNGPYYPKDNIDFSVFKNVIENVANKNPHYFIINGPFFSSENEKIKWGEYNTEEGMKSIINLLKEQFNNKRTKILICPGLSDNENFYPLPQPSFDKINDDLLYTNKKGKGDPEIIFISNPQIFSMNEAYIGVANFDTIKDIIYNSIHSPEINTVEKACEMILYQKNFYPILPNTLPQNYENNQERIVTVDLSQYKYMNFNNFESPPDIILTNSVMKPFAKRIYGTVFVNCGSFIKGKNYGEIAKITLHAPSQGITDINKRLKVEFIKINSNTNINNTNNKK